jgi:archaellum component FlaC
LISSGKRDEATLRMLRELFDEVLEWQPQVSSVYWRRYLVSVGCQNDRDIIYKGVLIEGNAAYENAIRHGNEEEREAYSLLVKARVRIVRLLEAELIKSEKSKKIGTDAQSKLAEFKTLLAKEEKQVAESIKKLENIDRAIREQAMDCSSIADEYKHALEKAHQEAVHIWRSPKSEISHEEKTNWESQLDALQRVSNAEYGKLNQLSSSHPAFAEYARLENEQKSVCAEINSGKSKLEKIKSDIEQLVRTIAQITQEYDSALKTMHKGNYSGVEKLLSKPRLESKIKQALQEVK